MILMSAGILRKVGRMEGTLLPVFQVDPTGKGLVDKYSKLVVLGVPAGLHGKQDTFVFLGTESTARQWSSGKHDQLTFLGYVLSEFY